MKNVLITENFNYKYTIAVLTSLLSDYRNLTIYKGILDASKQENVNVIQIDCGQFNSFQEKAQTSTILRNLVTSFHFNGIIVANSVFNNKLPEKTRNEFMKLFNHLPLVTIGNQVKPHACVKIDNYIQMVKVMKHLINDHGYRKIALLMRKKPLSKSIDYFTDKEKIFIKAYYDINTKYNIPVNKELIINNNVVDSKEYTQTLLNLVKKKTEAIIIPGRHGLNAIKIYNRYNIEVPKDIAIVCYSNYDYSNIIIPRFTSMNYMHYDKGRKALQLLVSILDGKIPAVQAEPYILKSPIIIQQSCGCNDSSSFTIKTEKNPHKLSIPAFILKNKNKIIKQMQTNMPILKIGESEYDDILNAFLLNLKNPDNFPFINTIEKIMSYSLDDSDDPTIMQNILTILITWIQNVNIEQALYVTAKKIIYQGRMHIFNISRQKMSATIYKQQLKLTAYQALKERIENILNFTQFYQLLTNELIRLNITTGFLVLYENPRPYKFPDPCPHWSRLVMAFKNGKPLPIENKKSRFITNQILPELFKEEIKKLKLAIIPLYYNEQQIGYIIFETNNIETIFYYRHLQIGIACALNNILLMTKMQKHSAQITRQKHILDTFMETVPYSIYFKNKQGNFINANPALKKSINISRSSPISGKNDYDFFPLKQAEENQNQDKLVMQIGKSLISITEKNLLNNRWELSTKMPLCDETGEIIGTFGISRDITEMKNTQMQLKTAYNEIKNLNDQLQTDNRRMKIELDLIRHLQQMLLPEKNELDKINKWQISAFMQPADEISGDYYDIIPHKKKLILGIGDVTGHGLESGVIMIMLHTALRSLVSVGESDPQHIYLTMNDFLYRNIKRMKANKMITLLIASVSENIINFTGYHDEPFIVTKNGQTKLISTMQHGIPIGIKSHIEKMISPNQFTINPGDSIIFYTDGITEARSEKGRYYGLERLQNIICDNRQKSPEQIKQNVINDLHRFLGNKKIYDDIALIVIRKPDD